MHVWSHCLPVIPHMQLQARKGTYSITEHLFSMHNVHTGYKLYILQDMDEEEEEGTKMKFVHMILFDLE